MLPQEGVEMTRKDFNPKQIGLTIPPNVLARANKVIKQKGTSVEWFFPREYPRAVATPQFCHSDPKK